MTSLLQETDQSIHMKSSNRPERVFSSLLLDQINFPDVNAVLDCQTQIIQKLDETNRSLTSTNQLSAETFNSFAVKDFQSYVALLAKMKADLELIFKHIRVVKSKLKAKYPSQYENAFNEFHISVDDDEDVGHSEKNDQEEIEVSRKTTIDKNSINNNSPLEFLTKERSMSNESDKSSSTKSILVNLFETARTRLSSMELVGGFVGVNGTQSSQQQHQLSNNEVDSEQQKLEPSEQPSFLNANTMEKLNDDNFKKLEIEKEDEKIVENVNKGDEGEGEEGDFQSVNLTSLNTDESTA